MIKQEGEGRGGSVETQFGGSTQNPCSTQDPEVPLCAQDGILEAAELGTRSTIVDAQHSKAR